MGQHPYYADKLADLQDVFGTTDVDLRDAHLVVRGHSYPIVDDVIVLLDPRQYPASLRGRLPEAGAPRQDDHPYSPEVQFSFGDEWQTYRDILPEHEEEFHQYADLLDLSAIGDWRVADLGCGIGRWSWHLRDVCRELVLVDFSEAIFVARDNLRDVPHALFFMGDVTRLPFRSGFADLIICLGVLHHLPVPALDQVRALRRFADRMLIYLYYALDNRPFWFRWLLGPVTLVRRICSRITSSALRRAVAWLGALLVYVPLIWVGRGLDRIGLGRLVPLHDTYRGKSLRRIQQDVYDRFFTSIEQRFSRAEIETLRDSFERVAVSDGLPYWHFLCEGPIP